MIWRGECLAERAEREMEMAIDLNPGILASVAVITLFAFGTGHGFAILALFASALIFLGGSVDSQGFAELGLLSLILAPLLGVFFAAVFLDDGALPSGMRLFRPLALVASLLFFVESGYFLRYLERFVELSSEHSTFGEWSASIVSLGSGILFSGGMIALVYLLLAGFFEASLHLVARASAVKQALPLRSLRPILLVVLFSLGFHIMSESLFLRFVAE